MDPHAARELLEYLQTCYPVFFLLLFFVVFLASSMAKAGKLNEHDPHRVGPGGRPLPRRSRSSGVNVRKEFSKNVKHVFNWLSVGVLVTFLADSAIYILHVMVARSENWWRGQASVVSCLSDNRTTPRPRPETLVSRKQNDLIC